MGGSFSQNAVDQTLKNFTDITTSAASGSIMSQEEAQSISCTGQGDVDIENINFNQNQIVDVTQALTAVDTANAQQTSEAQMKQLAQALTKGINFANVSFASNTANQVLSNSIGISHKLQENCQGDFNEFQSINGNSLGKTCTIKNIWFNQTQNLMSNCAAEMVTRDATLQSAKAVADQTAIAKTEGLDIMGWLILGLVIILAIPVTLLSVGGAKGKSGGGGAVKAGNTILGLLGTALLISGIVMICVGDKETITLYGYVDKADFTSCGTPSTIVDGVKSIGAASTGCLNANSDKPGSCDGFYYDEDAEQMTVYTNVKNKPCGGMTDYIDTDKPENADAGKKWAGFVETPHPIRNIGIGLTCGGALCIILIVVFIFTNKRPAAVIVQPV
jgi:hypothetical protein